MLKKCVAVLLSLVLTVSLSVPALAASEESLDNQLKAVTIAVKDTLGVGDQYTEFYGDYSMRGTTRYWNLNWNSETESLSVMADDFGKIYSYYRYLKNEVYSYDNTFSPMFPSVTREQAAASADSFLDRVLGAGESVSFENQTRRSPSDVRNYNFYGALQSSGLKTPSWVNVTVRTDDLSVTGFSRDDSYTVYVGGVPSPKPEVSAELAAKQLGETLKLELRYVADTQGEDGAHAVLRYVPVYNGNYLVDAKSGALINVDALYEEMKRDGGGYGMGTADEAASPAAGKSSLTGPETEGIKKLEGVLTQERLDAALRGITVIGLTGSYSLGSVSYYLNRETGEVTASLSYWMEVTNAAQAGLSDAGLKSLQDAGMTPYIYKYVSANAKTGALLSLSTYYSGFGSEEPSGDAKAADLPTAADTFLKSWHGAQYAQTARYSAVRTMNGTIACDNYVFARTANGYFYPDNQIYISVNQKSGTIDALSYSWTDDMEFENAGQIVSEQDALAAYAGAFAAKLSYRNLPVELNPSDPGLISYIKMGYQYVYRLALAYTLEAENAVLGVDAKTGEVISQTQEEEKGITYSDIDGIYAQSMIEELAEYGVGYYGGVFQPSATLTQKDMLLLLVSAQGYRFEPENLDLEYLYSVAYSLGILDSAERSPDAAVTRAQLVKTLVKLSGYGKAAELPGIYLCGFSDDKDIPANLYGYMAIGKGLGIIGGYEDGTVRPNRETTRAEAAVMLYHLMDRNR